MPITDLNEAMDLRRPLMRRRFAERRKHGARLMLATPALIERALQPSIFGPVPSTVARRLQVCRARLDGEIKRGRAGCWTYEPNRQIALEQALLALRWQRRFVERARHVVPMEAA